MTDEYNPCFTDTEGSEAARRAEPITRGELNDALLALANAYAERRDHDGDLACNLLLALRERLL